ncbi:MAG: PadR family transcriptional regulator [Acidobacteriota bacterium]
MEPNDLLPLPAPVFHILVALAEGERHGYSIMRDAEERTHGALRLSPGTLYGSIRRMLEQGLIEEVERRAPADDERRRYYRLTKFGRRTAEAEASRLAELLGKARAHGLLTQRG